MQFHVSVKVSDAIVLDADKQLRLVLGPALQSVMQSGKVRASGLLGGMRGAFFVIEVNEAVELYELFGPEIYANCELSVHPIVPIEKAGELFQQWAQAGR